MTHASQPELRRVLCVEDDEDIRMVAEMALASVGKLEVLMCASGPEAIEKAEAFGPDLLLLDVMMPEMDGPTTLARLRELASITDVPAVFLTAKAHKFDLEPLKALGAIGVVTKPFKASTLATELRKLWGASA